MNCQENNSVQISSEASDDSFEYRSIYEPDFKQQNFWDQKRAQKEVKEKGQKFHNKCIKMAYEKLNQLKREKYLIQLDKENKKIQKQKEDKRLAFQQFLKGKQCIDLNSGEEEDKLGQFTQQKVKQKPQNRKNCNSMYTIQAAQMYHPCIYSSNITRNFMHDGQKQKMITDFLNGWDIKVLAYKYNVCLATVKRYCHHKA